MLSGGWVALPPPSAVGSTGGILSGGIASGKVSPSLRRGVRPRREPSVQRRSAEPLTTPLSYQKPGRFRPRFGRQNRQETPEKPGRGAGRPAKLAGPRREGSAMHTGAVNLARF